MYFGQLGESELLRKRADWDKSDGRPYDFDIDPELWGKHKH